MSNNVVKVIAEVLSRVEVPGFDIDLMSSGVIRGFRLSEDGRKVIVFVDFLTSDPGCLFCKFINHTLWNSISTRIKEVLKGIGMDEVIVMDVQTKREL